MALRRKAMFFTLISVLLVTIIIISFTFYSSYRTQSKMFVVETRVNTMDRFIEDLEKDMERALYIAGFRAILGAEDYIIKNGEYLDNPSSLLGELAINGTLNGTQLNLTIDSSLSDWFDRVSIQGQNIGVEMNYTMLGFEINQSDPWFIDFYVDLELDISDTKGIAKWNRNKTAFGTVSIVGLEDPVYTIGAYGRTTRIINKTEDNIQGIDDLKDFLDSGAYRANSDAPSFLMRLEGNLSSSPYGIETLVNTNEFAFYELNVYDRSSIDYIYFGTHSTTGYKIYNITDVYMEGFRLDQDHIDEFDVNDFKY